MANVLVVLGIVCLSLYFQSSQQESSCGVRRVKRIVDGQEARPYSWPWQVHMQVKKNDKFVHKCGGALIDKHWIVTAAHCVFANPKPEDYRIILGDFDRSRDEATEQSFDVTQIHLHRRFFTDKGYGYDIAVMKLSREVKMTFAVAPVCLPSQGDRAKNGSTCYVTGWGKTSITADKATKLRQAEMPIVTQEQCQAGNSWFQPVDEESMICAGHGGGSSISGCNGDSGGPFVCEEDGRWVLRGVVSWGDPKCSAGTTYSVFARISSFIDWMNGEMSAKPPPAPIGCSDDHKWCPKWKKSGFCNNGWFHDRLELYCRKTCGHCRG